MSSANNSRDDNIGRQDERRYRDDRRHRDDRRRSHSRSRTRRYRDEIEHRSRSRSRSVDRHRRRRQRSRSGSRSRYSSHRKSSRRYESSRSRSRSGHRSNRHNRHSSSRSPRPSLQKYESKNECSESTERHQMDRKSNEKPECRSNSVSRRSMDEDNSSSQYFSSTQDLDTLENLPLPEQTESHSNSYEYFDDSQEPIDKERIHREMEQKLREALAKEGKVYPPKKPEASHPVFANDGSFLEIFKKMQEAQQTMTATTSTTVPTFGITVPSTSSVAHSVPIVPNKSGPPPPLVGRRRGGKILKTGVVAKPKVTDSGGDDKDFWSLYLAEVNKYKNNACELNSGNRPLLK